MSSDGAGRVLDPRASTHRSVLYLWLLIRRLGFAAVSRAAIRWPSDLSHSIHQSSEKAVICGTTSGAINLRDGPFITLKNQHLILSCDVYHPGWI
jgi:hypothetical protein